VQEREPKPEPRPTRGRRPRPVAAPPRLLAAIDVGSDAIRMAISELVSGSPDLRHVEHLSVPISIGADTFQTGRISSATTRKVGQTLKDFRAVLDTYQVPAARAVTTTAVRDAANRDVFIDRVERISGIRLEVIEAIEETRLLYQYIDHSIGARFGFRRGVCMVLSLGAGSTEIIIQRDGLIVFAETRQMGTLRLVQTTRVPQPSLTSALEAFLGKVSRSITRIHDLPPVGHLIVLSDPLPKLLARAGRTETDLGAMVIARGEFLRLFHALEHESPDDLAERYGLSHAEAERGRVALLELNAFLDITRARRVAFPEASMLDGMILDARSATEAAARTGEPPLWRQIDSAACALGQKYRFDEHHSRQVQALALQLFDGLTEVCGLDPASRLYLSVAALLHDIGTFVSDKAHHRHAAYLISASEIIGLSQAELDEIALIARFHRKAFPGPGSPELAALPPARRVEVTKLAALLRLADALDRDHMQRVERVRIEAQEDVVVLYARSRHAARESFTVNEYAVRSKSDLFAETFGLRIEVREELG
jgi:exopolyphosphatase/guanosine-5'-triphosphate,3'-diphosphate pyrophosphatase